MTLDNKNAVIYGAGGSLGGAVAEALAAAGARVFLTGRSLVSVKPVADRIIASGGKADVDVVDALDANAIDSHLERVIREAGGVHISFNATGTQVVQNVPMITMSADDFMHPVNFMLRTQFLTATAAANVMVPQRKGVILTLTATPGGIGYPFTAGFAPACTAIETFGSNLAAELGIHGVRVVNIRSGGSPDSRVFRNAIDNHAEEMRPVLEKMRADAMLKQLPMMADIAGVAVFLASDWAGKITGVTVDVTCGTTAGLNYRVTE